MRAPCPAAPGAGSTLHSCWVRGVRVVRHGAPANVDLVKLRQVIMEAQPEYRDPAVTDPAALDMVARAEVEYRAAMGRAACRVCGCSPVATSSTT